jgi:ATP-dependent exoDNAse (exonuclease V) alpha subunit
MAIFHLNVHVVSRGKGQSAIAKAAYNSRTKLEDERTGINKDYSRVGGVQFSGVFAPKDAPEWAKDREQLWNHVERREDESNRANSAQLAREIRIALPHELTDQQREWLVKDFVREELTRKGMVADVNIHAPRGRRRRTELSRAHSRDHAKHRPGWFRAEGARVEWQGPGRALA